MRFCQEAEAGDRVLLSGDAAAPLVAVAESLLAVGAVPVVGDVSDEARDALLGLGGGVDGAERTAVEKWQSVVGYVRVPTSAFEAAKDPEGEAGALVRRLRMTIRKTTTRWPDAALAERAGMSLAELERHYARLLYLDEGDPVARFVELREFQAGLIEQLSRAKVVRVQGDGTDLTLKVAGRTWINSYGRQNVPSGEVYTSPLEDSARGAIRFDVPSYVSGGRVSGVTVEFRDGEVVRAVADEGAELLEARLATDEGAKRVGEVGIGANARMTTPLGATLFDEKIAGTVHLALGASYPKAGGLNDSKIHWDLIKDLRGGGLVTVDGERFQEDGRFV